MATTYQAYGYPQQHQPRPVSAQYQPRTQQSAYPFAYLSPHGAAPSYPPSATTLGTAADSPFYPHAKPTGHPREISRTPSPTPSEEKELKTGVFDWKTLTNWRFWFRKEWIWYYVVLIIILVVTALVTLYHKQIVEWLTPVTRWLHDLSFGWLVPIGVLFVISFPPLFGHEIVAILCGLVWGLWIGFAIVSAGTFLGEVGNYYAFKYCCRARGEKLEKSKISYACLAKVVRDGGFWIALVARLSAIPGHFTTAVFSTCGMGIIVFSIAAILSMPKQFITVYLGVILEQSNTGVRDTKSRIISDVVLAVTFVITVVAMWYIYHRMNKVKPIVIYERRKARQAKLSRMNSSPYNNSFASESTVAFNPPDAEADAIPLKSASSPGVPGAMDVEADASVYPHQRWDRHGHAVGYAPNPNLVSAYSPRGRETKGHVPRESTDEVGWDMRDMRARSVLPQAQPGLYAVRGDVAGSEETVRGAGAGAGVPTGDQDHSAGERGQVSPPPGLHHRHVTATSVDIAAQDPSSYAQDHEQHPRPSFAPALTASPPPSHPQDLPDHLPTSSHFQDTQRDPASSLHYTQVSHDVPFSQSQSQRQFVGQATHQQQATDASYRTAVSSASRESSYDSQVDDRSGLLQQQPYNQPYYQHRVGSPPPPSYRSNLP